MYNFDVNVLLLTLIPEAPLVMIFANLCFQLYSTFESWHYLDMGHWQAALDPPVVQTTVLHGDGHDEAPEEHVVGGVEIVDGDLSCGLSSLTRQ